MIKINTTLIILSLLIYVNAKVSILATGELHGQLSSCNCPDDPGGGVARISAIAQEYREIEPILLVDAGGFAAGGVYDLETAGKTTDSIKTGLMIDAFGIAGYDAIGIGDEELQYAPQWLLNMSRQYGVDLLSANVIKTDSSFWFKPYKVVKKGNYNFLITSIVNNERILNLDNNILISEPFTALNNLISNVKEDFDYLIILSHLGELLSEKLINKQNEYKIIVVNGHRKFSTDAGLKLDENVLMQFGFQGKMISKTVISEDGLQTPKWLINDESYKLDKSIHKLSESYKLFLKNNRQDIYDLYIMSQCPYGLPALYDLHSYLSRQIIANELNVWFIGDVDSLGGLKSLHGENEISEELNWLAIKSLYPEYWSLFLTLVSSREFSTTNAINELNIDTNKLNIWINKNGKTALEMHYNRSNRLNIDASPTLFYNNRPFDGEITSLFIRTRECNKNGDIKKLRCDSLPDCFLDSDCYKKGFLGKCSREESGWGKCEFNKDAEFDFTIITTEDLVFKVDQDMINTTEEMFPGARIEKILLNQANTIKILSKYNINSVPFATFSKDIDQTKNFDAIKDGLKLENNQYLFKKEFVEGTYHFNRKKINGKIEIFLNSEIGDPNFKELLINFIENFNNEKLFIYPIISDSLKIPENLSTIELSYMKKYKELFGGKEFFNNEKAVSLNPKMLNDYYKNYIKTLNEMGKGESVLILINNREVVIPHNNNEMKAIVQKLSQL